jgi:hypothetical protein
VAERHPRIIHLVHSVPGRARLRLTWLHEFPDDAAPLAEHLARLDESIEVRVRPWTGSVLCSYDPERLNEERIVAAVRRHTRVAIVLRPGESHPEAPGPLRRAPRTATSTIRRAMTDAFRGLNQEVLEVTEGRLDLGALAGLSFLTLGASEIIRTRAAPVPPWFNLAWWAYRTFTISSPEPGEEDSDPEGGDGGEVEDASAEA